MATDRELLKQAQKGHIDSAGLSNAETAVQNAHKRTISAQMTTGAAAGTNTAEAGMGVLVRKSKSSAAYIVVEANVAADTTDFVRYYVYKRASTGGSQVQLAIWNTHSSANGALTRWTAHAMSMTTNANATIDAGSVITYEITKGGSGKVTNNVSFVLDVEEI
jgi:hypothetical protein